MSRLFVSARELTTLGIDLLREAPAAPKAHQWMHDAAQRAGPRATRRHNLAVACSMLGSQAEIARRMADATGTRGESCRTAIARILAYERPMSEEFALLVERIMGWGYFDMTTLWLERRQTAALALPKHIRERRHWKL